MLRALALLACALPLVSCAAPGEEDAGSGDGAMVSWGASRTKIAPGHYVDPASGAALWVRLSDDKVLVRGYYPNSVYTNLNEYLDVDLFPGTDGWDDWGQGSGWESYSARATADGNVEMRWHKKGGAMGPETSGQAKLLRDRDASVRTYPLYGGKGRLSVLHSDSSGARVRLEQDGASAELEGRWLGPIELGFEICGGLRQLTLFREGAGVSADGIACALPLPPPAASR